MFLKSIFTIAKLCLVVLVVMLYIHYFFPQSWGFYTVESKQPLYDIYKVNKGIAGKQSLIKNNFSYGMGVSRKGKILFSELYSIIGKKDLPWKPLFEDSLNYITQHGNYILLSTVGERAYLRGSFLIVKTGRPSYLDLKNGGRFHPSKQFILAEIR